MERFSYHAFAIGLAGRIEEPFNEILPIQTSVALPDAGGFNTVCAERFSFHNIISAESVVAVVAGSHSKRDGPHSKRDGTYDSLSTVTIENLDVLGMVKADAIVGRIAAIHPEDGSPASIIPLGSHFENLRIAGKRVDVDLATDTFTLLDTVDKVREAYRTNEGRFRKEFDALSLLGRSEEIPPRFRSYFPLHSREAAESIPERNGEICCGLVRKIEGLPEGVPFGHIIPIRGFGVIRLAEFRITASARRLVMLQIDLGSTPQGTVSGGDVEGNGSGWVG